MTSRQAGRRISTIASQRHPAGRRKGSAPARRAGGGAPLSPRERRRLLQLVACCGIFVLLVAVKLLLPAKMAQFNQRLSGMLEQNMDVRAVFSAVGEAVSGQRDVGGTLEEVYRAVFQPQEEQPGETAVLTGGEAHMTEPDAIGSLQAFRTGEEEHGGWPGGTASQESDPAEAPEAEKTEQPAEAAAETLSYVLYSEGNLPEDVSMEQAMLGFSYCTPVVGTLSSGFGYREHPVEGEERFHYGLDIAADTGTAIACFADGTVTAVGESSSYGKYCMVEHAGGYTTLYAHCSRVTARSGASVRAGEPIAEVGQTGIATGPHLHFEIRRQGTYLNPIYYVSLL